MKVLSYGWIAVMKAYWFLLGQGIPVKVVYEKDKGFGVILHPWHSYNGGRMQ